MHKQEYDKMYQLEDRHWWFLGKRHFISSIFPISTKSSNILDVGSGTGGMSLFLNKYGKVTRVEPSISGQKYLRLRKLNFVPETIERCSFPINSFDIICLFDVLYHKKIKNDEVVLKKVYSWLKPGGYILITDCALPFLYGYHDDLVCARQRYLLSTMKNKVQNTGFYIEKSTYIYFLLFFPLAMFRFMQNKLKISGVDEVSNKMNKILLAACVLESKLIKHINMPFGTSILIKAKKP